MSEEIGEIAIILMSIRDQVKVFHWQTESYSKHKSSDALVSALTNQMDLFIETIQGTRGIRLKIPKSNNIVIDNQTNTSVLEVLETFKIWLTSSSGLLRYLMKNETDLLTIRDEMLQTVNQTIYLFGLK